MKYVISLSKGAMLNFLKFPEIIPSQKIETSLTLSGYSKVMLDLF